MRSKKWLTVMVLGLAISLLATTFGCGGGAEVPQATSIGTMPKGSLTNTVGAGLAKVISDHTAITVVDRPYAGYSSYVPQVHKGELDMCLVTSPELNYAWNGLGTYTEKNNNLRVVSSGTPLRISFITRLDSGIKTAADLGGKRYAADIANIITKEFELTLLRTGGLDPEKDAIPVPVAGVVETVQAFIEGRVDVSHTSVGHPKTKEAIAKLGGVYFLPVCQSENDAAAQRIRKELPGVDVMFIKAGGAPDVSNDTWVYVYPYNLVANKDFSEEAVYQVAKAIHENGAELDAIHPQLRNWSKGMVSPKVVIPYHPGAIRYYKEIGAWTAEMEQVQQRLLSQ